jgi:hypothetical protein
MIFRRAQVRDRTPSGGCAGEIFKGVEEKGPSTPLEAGTASIALLAFRRQPVFDNINPLAIRAVQHLNDHRFPHAR